MTVMSAVEKELIKATKVKPDKYDDRQDFLAAILKAMEPSRFSEEDFDALSDEAADWHTKQAVPAMNRKQEIPDFTDHEAEEAAESAEADEEADDDVDETEDEDSSDDPEDEAEVESDNDSEAFDEDADAESDPEPPVKAAKPAKGKKVAAKPAKAIKPAKATKASAKPIEGEKSKPKREPRDYSGLTGEKDRYGIIIGTQTSKAVAMYEKGATAKEIKDKLDGRYYNVLARMTKDGHLVEKLEGNVWKLTHRDDVKGKAKSPVKVAAKVVKPAKKGK